MKRFLSLLLINITVAVTALSANATVFYATPVTLTFAEMNPMYLDAYFSFGQSTDGVVTLQISVRTQLPRGLGDIRRAVTVFPGTRLQMIGDQVYLVGNHRSILVAHKGGGVFGGWNLDHATLSLPKNISYERNQVTISPVLNVALGTN